MISTRNEQPIKQPLAGVKSDEGIASLLAHRSRLTICDVEA